MFAFCDINSVLNAWYADARFEVNNVLMVRLKCNAWWSCQFLNSECCNFVTCIDYEYQPLDTALFWLMIFV